MGSKFFLAIVGLMYLGLAAWCSLSPETTSNKVGFELLGGSGQSEFFVIYGGLELSLALFFLLPLLRAKYLASSLLFCAILHGCLVVFRTISLLMYTNIEQMTYQLAIGEWLIFLLSILFLVLGRKPSEIDSDVAVNSV